ncbi:DUF2283 domain-containing protein [Streptosporangium sp. G12]
MSPIEVPATFAYDPEVGAAYVALAPMPPGGVAQTVEVHAVVQADLDEDGRLLGIEIVGALPGTVNATEESL